MSASTLSKDAALLDVTPTREIYPMTSMQETVEFLYDKVKQLSRRAFQTSESVESLAAKVEELSTSIELSHQKLDELSARAPENIQPDAPHPEPVTRFFVDEFGSRSRRSRLFSQAARIPSQSRSRVFTPRSPMQTQTKGSRPACGGASSQSSRLSRSRSRIVSRSSRIAHHYTFVGSPSSCSNRSPSPAHPSLQSRRPAASSAATCACSPRMKCRT